MSTGKYDADIRALGMWSKADLLWALQQRCEGIRNNTLLVDLAEAIGRKKLAEAETAYETAVDKFFTAREQYVEWVDLMIGKYGKSQTRIMTESEREQGELLHSVSAEARSIMDAAARERERIAKYVLKREAKY